MNNYFITGSSALEHNLKTYYSFSGMKVHPKDLDIFYIKGTKKPEISSDLKVEYHEIPEQLFDKFVFCDDYFLDLESLYVLKLSHAEYNVHWQKTVNHIHMMKPLLRQKYSATADLLTFMPHRYTILFNELKEFWKTVHRSKEKIKLNMSKDKFFNNKVIRKYDHDFLHEIVKYENEPMYKKCLKDGHEVLLDEQKFNALTRAQKLQLCREEIYVIALERLLIPNDFKLCEHESYKMALKRVVTTMTKGWFPTFIVDNYDVLCKIDKNYMKIFQERINNDSQNAQNA